MQADSRESNSSGQQRPAVCPYIASIINRVIIFVQGIYNLDLISCEIKPRIAMAKAAFSKKKTLFTSKLDLNLRKKLIKCYIWSMALYGAETWALLAADQKYLESFEMWCWRRMEKISWTDHERNEKVLLKSQ